MRHLAHLAAVKSVIAHQPLRICLLCLEELSYLTFCRTLIACKRRAALYIFSQIQIEHQRIAEVCKLLLRILEVLFQETVHDLIAAQSAVAETKETLFLIIGCQRKEHGGRVGKLFFQKSQSTGELSAVVMDFHHLFHFF